MSRVALDAICHECLKGFLAPLIEGSERYEQGIEGSEIREVTPLPLSIHSPDHNHQWG